MATTPPVTLETIIPVKVSFAGQVRKFKIPLEQLTAEHLPQKVCPPLSSPCRSFRSIHDLLDIPEDDSLLLERYSDSQQSYVTLDPNNVSVYKTLFRAAKAKLKLKLRATLVPRHVDEVIRPPSPCTPPQPRFRQRPSPAAELGACVETANKSTEQSGTEEAPVPRPFTAAPSRNTFRFPGPSANDSTGQDETRRSSEILTLRPKYSWKSAWVVFCNRCESPMTNVHYHCGVCENGDYDLCTTCVDAGQHCPSPEHWLVKRFVNDGVVESSKTERLPPKRFRKDEEPKPAAETGMPGAFVQEQPPVPSPAVADVPEEPGRTCNCCVQAVMPENEFVTCTTCEDYDLCVQCHVQNKHGHHPGHEFKAATQATGLSPVATLLCNAGRNVRHSAICDGCEKYIYGVRHKCLNCPDWDFCAGCFSNASRNHPRHRFVPIYEPLAEPWAAGTRHYGIYCDGPLCKGKATLSYIEGVRYKCTVCHDTDFCANCEAHPTNKHNHTHPLLKFKTPVRKVSVTTMNESMDGRRMTRHGDVSEAARPSPPANTASQIRTVLDMCPTEQGQSGVAKEKITVNDLLCDPADVAQTSRNVVQQPTAAINAHFVRDAVPDGSSVRAGQTVLQCWILRNPGPTAWPAGCKVKYIGGDNMLNVDNSRPISQRELDGASQSQGTSRPIAAGEEVGFRVVMKAPPRPGSAVSYWRLMKDDGTLFGPRLWCDIKVLPRAPTPPAPKMPERETVSESPAPAARPAEQKSVSEPQRAEPEGTVQGPDVAAARPDTSGMVFPKLEKESPASSLHEAAAPMPVEDAQVVEASPAATSEPSDTEFFEDAESVDIESFASEEEAGFLTDEEYDVLHASDEDSM
ncbi:hypothetical protein M011DRAFT_406676 [Sporormia fimetaria CBS 119925]|uniref:ZZ-type domain-containing protein n=1 Tax=Sporormia fimetaria CBS 119925 TaxID=1340428 RepID=A0A6A6V6D1_9PLEO|nr:hypothetical protein M011DRAFT_406676 [Sporormia fimetaria CBS 119925]